MNSINTYRVARLAFALVMPLIAVAAASAQGAVHAISGTATCEGCRIERYLLATLEDDSLPGVVGPFAQVYVTRSAQFIITRPGVPTPFVADARGHVFRQVSRPGNGPGEFRMARRVTAHRNGYSVFDLGSGRVTHLDHQFRYVGSSPFPVTHMSGAVPVGDSAFVVSTGSEARQSANGPLHLVSSGRVKSFGGRPAAAVELPPSRLIAAGPKGTIWAAYRNKYVIERWDTTGTLIEVIERRAPWFPAAAPGDLSRGIRNVHVDSAGLLWVQSVVREPKLTTYIEVLDPQLHRVVATAKVEDWAGDPVGGGLFILTHRELEGGEPRIDIWGFRLRRANDRTPAVFAQH